MSTIQSLTHYFTTPKPSFHYDSSIFDGWFGIPFQDSLHTTHIRAPHLSEILTLYNLSSLIPLYILLLSSNIFCISF